MNEEANTQSKLAAQVLVLRDEVEMLKRHRQEQALRMGQLCMAVGTDNYEGAMEQIKEMRAARDLLQARVDELETSLDEAEQAKPSTAKHSRKRVTAQEATDG